MEKKTICSLFVLIGIMMLQLQWKSEPEIIRNLHAQIQTLETVVNNLKELAFSAVKSFDVNNDLKAFSKQLDTTIDFLPASNFWFFKNIIPAAEAMIQTNCRKCYFTSRRWSFRVRIKETTSRPKIRVRNPRELSAVSTNRSRFTPRSETTTRPSSKPVYKSNVPNLPTTPLPSSPDDWTTQASFPNEGTFTTNKTKLIHVKISSVNLNPTGSRHVNIAIDNKTGSDNVSSATERTTEEEEEEEAECSLDMEDIQIIKRQLKQRGDRVMDIGNENDAELRLEQILEKVEVVLLCCSIGAITIYYIVLLVLRVKITEKIFVHVNMLLSLGLGHLVFVLDLTVFTNRAEHPVLCSTVVVTLHFLQTALFTWMFVEGINLYNKLVKVFSMRKQYVVFAAIGWGIPAVIVGITAAIKPSTYDMEAPLKEVICGPLNFTGRPERDSCWLNGSMWIYKGPVLFFLLVNMGMFLILLRVIFGKLSNKYNKEHVKFARKGIRSMLALLPLLGVTYILAYFPQFHIAVEYLFVLLNSTQGVTFTIFHCVFDDQITEGLKKLCGKNTVPQKPRKNPKTPKETNKKKSKDGAHPTRVKVVKMNGANQTTKGTNV